MTTDIDQLVETLEGFLARGFETVPGWHEAHAALDTLREEFEGLKRDVAAESENASVFMAQLERQEAEIERLRMDLAGEPYHHHVTATPPNQEPRRPPLFPGDRAMLRKLPTPPNQEDEG